MFVNGIYIRNLKFSNTQLSTLKDNSLQYLRTMLETLAITNSKLNQVSSGCTKQIVRCDVMCAERNECPLLLPVKNEKQQRSLFIINIPVCFSLAI